MYTLICAFALQREIKRKTLTYGIGAILLAVLLTSIIVNYQNQNISPFDPGPSPEASEPTEPSEPEPTPPIPDEPSLSPPHIIPVVPSPPPEPPPPEEFSNLKTFSNKVELENFILDGLEKAKNIDSYPQFSLLEDMQRTSLPMEAPTFAGEEADIQYSTTNIQVQGVDEADTVKSDGEFLYVVSGTTLYLLKAYPTNQAQVLSKIELDNYGAQIYVSDDKLVVLGNQNWLYTTRFTEEIAITDQAFGIYPYIYTEEMFVKTYDITNRANPILSRTLIINGTLSGSRMIDGYVYTVVNQPMIVEGSNETSFEVILPTISGDHNKEIEPNQIRYIDVPDTYYRLTTILAVNMKDDTHEPTCESFLASHTTNMYVSINNMYLVVPNTNHWFIREIGNEIRDESIIYRIKLDQEKIMVMAEGSVAGYILNQYSMDEYDNYFRVATTEWKIDGSLNNLFILDMSMSQVGQIMGLAQGERIYSARFMGDRCYLVTFRQFDPFFVIDIANPDDPFVLGFLKIPGFSGYLHPYDQGHIIGIGKEDSNLKLSLFDVTDVSNPTEQAKYLVDADWSDSSVLWDSKAFLFENSKQLLALPVSISQYQTFAPSTNWQGAYIFNLTLENGFMLEGSITHRNPEDRYLGDLEVKRILYIEEALYTISDKIVKINNIDTLDYVTQIELS